jgi:hypothetical protein
MGAIKTRKSNSLKPKCNTAAVSDFSIYVMTVP